MAKHYPCKSREGVPKKKWATENAAIFVARWHSRQDGKRRRSYFCFDCEKWHVYTVRDGSTDPDSKLST